MNKEQYLLICLAEECSEVQQCVTKSLRFGLTDVHPKYNNLTNRARLTEEIIDVLALIEMCTEQGLFELPVTPTLQGVISAKKANVEKFIKYSQERGIVTNIFE